MSSLEALKQIEKELYLLLPKNIRDTLIQTIKQDLERLKQLEKENQEWKEAYIKVNEELHCAFARGTDSARFDVLEENEKLEKALDKACEMIAICPPIDVDVETCEKVENECKECWKKYFLKEVLCND